MEGNQQGKMLRFKKISFKNFMSAGNIPVELDLSSPGISLLTGPNGAGKSSFIAAIFYALFGKPFKRGLPLGEMVNSANKERMLAELSFSSGGKNYLVRRGRKPDVFEIEENGEPIPFSSVKDSQKILSGIVKMDPAAFKQLCVICSSSHTPFPKLPAGEKRAVVDSALGLDVFSEMLELAKAENARSKEELRQLECELEKIHHRRDIALERAAAEKRGFQGRIEEKKGEKRKIKESLPAALARLAELSSAEEGKEERISALRLEMEGAGREIMRAAARKEEAEKRIAELEKEIEFFAHAERCPLCSQPISKKLAGEFKKEKEDRLAAENAMIEKGEGGISAAKKRKSELSLSLAGALEAKKDFREAKNWLLAQKKALEDLDRSIESLEGEKEKAEGAGRDLSSAEEAMAGKLSEILSKKSERQELEILMGFLSDSGAKKAIARKYIPAINQIIKKYLSILELPYAFSFNEDFRAEIKMRGKSGCDFDTLSEGEAARMNFILLFVFREFAKIRNCLETNLLFIDEIGDAALDAEGISCLNMILSRQPADQSIFIISHYHQHFEGLAERVFEISKSAEGFTKLKCQKN